DRRGAVRDRRLPAPGTRRPGHGARSGPMSSQHGTGTAHGAREARPAAADEGTGSDRSAAHRRMVAVLLLVVALGALGLVALGAAADRGSEPVYQGGTEGTYRWAPQREDYSEPDWSTEDVTT